MKNGKKKRIRAIWSQPNSVEPHKRTQTSKDIVTALFMRKQQQSKAKNDQYYQAILKHRETLLSPRIMSKEQALNSKTSIQRLHMPKRQNKL